MFSISCLKLVYFDIDLKQSHFKCRLHVSIYLHSIYFNNFTHSWSFQTNRIWNLQWQNWFTNWIIYKNYAFSSLYSIFRLMYLATLCWLFWKERIRRKWYIRRCFCRHLVKFCPQPLKLNHIDLESYSRLYRFFIYRYTVLHFKGDTLNKLKNVCKHMKLDSMGPQ